MGLIEVPNVLALPKVLGFLPFYVVGMHMNREAFERLGARPVRIASATILGIALIVCYIYSHNWTLSWLLWKQRYDESPLRATPLEGITQRAELLVLGFVLTFAALSLVPKAKSWTTALGGRTFYCYLLHGYVILLLDLQFDVFDKIEKYGVNAVFVCIIGALILGNLLMTKPVSVLFRPFFEPKLKGLFREAEERRAAEQMGDRA